MAQMSWDAIEKPTGTSGEAWCALLDERGAAQLNHTAIAAITTEAIADIASAGWWAQAVAIAYEQDRGLRVVGQTHDGAFAANASKTVPGTMDEVLERWSAYMGEPSDLNGVPLDRAPSTSATEKWRYWRCTLVNGSKVNGTINAKSPEKVTLAIQHADLSSLEERDAWRDFWKATLKGFA